MLPIIHTPYSIKPSAIIHRSKYTDLTEQCCDCTVILLCIFSLILPFYLSCPPCLYILCVTSFCVSCQFVVAGWTLTLTVMIIRQ